MKIKNAFKCGDYQELRGGESEEVQINMHKVPVKQDEESREIHCITWYLCCCCCLVASVVSDSMRPHRGKPTRLPRPWDSLGKNTGVGRHFLLQCVKEKSESEVTQSCPTLSDPMDCSLSGSAIHGIFQARVLEWGAIAFSNGIYSQP